MGITKPYRRTARPFANGKNGGDYLRHHLFAQNPRNYVRGFLLIQKDFLNLTDYVEPADQNLATYSYRIHELLLRTSIEFEANCKAILRENDYSKKNNWNIKDYRKIDKSHRLSDFYVEMPFWTGCMSRIRPFEEWEQDNTLPWYQAYNNAKHDRQERFPEATFEQLVKALGGLVAILSAQFHVEDFGKGPDYIITGPRDDFSTAIGDLFRVKFPNNWLEEEKYDFDWVDIEQDEDPFQKFDYDSV